MTRHHIASAISSAAQEYLLALRVMAVDGSKVTAAQVGRHLGVTTQAASEMFRRLTADGLVSQSGGRELILTEPGRVAALEQRRPTEPGCGVVTKPTHR